MPDRRLRCRDRSRSPDRLRHVLAAAAVLIATAVHAADSPSRPTDALLALPMHGVWTDVPLGDWATRATAAGTSAAAAIVLDSRIDPDSRVSITCRGEPLAEIADRVAAAAAASVDVLDATLRIVPSDRAGIAPRAEVARRSAIAALPPARRRTLERRAPIRWPAGATPRGIVAAVVEAAAIHLDGLDAIPHDHLPAMMLPPLSLAERLDLLLASYDLRVDWRRDGGHIVPIDMGLEGVQAPERPRRPGKIPAAVAGTQRFTLRLAAPLDEAVPVLARQLGLEGHIDRESLAARGIQPGEIVRVEVRDVTRDALFDALVGPLGLRWRIDANQLTIDAPPQ
jgi:hypothetical protein